MLFITNWLVLLLQKGDARRNFSRFFLETHPFTTWGYCSYPMYLFQRIAFAYYAPAVFFTTEGESRGRRNHFHGDIREIPPLWFESLPLGKKFVGVLTLTAFCWLVQKYVQDQFVPWLYAKVVSCTATHTRKHCPST
jgi:peptidoglycan/LPS O-acetylase OafA/YrhL